MLRFRKGRLGDVSSLQNTPPCFIFIHRFKELFGGVVIAAEQYQYRSRETLHGTEHSFLKGLCFCFIGLVSLLARFFQVP